MKKNIILVLLTMFIAIGVNISKISAAEAGTTMYNPIDISFGQDYSKSWSRNTDHLFHYNKISVTAKGIVIMNFTKPFDSEGEYGGLEITVSDENGNAIWNTMSSNSKESASNIYSYKIGLEPGVYYVLVKPTFIVRQGLITTNYNFSFEQNDYIEVEPNEDMSQATNLEINQLYTAFYGNDYGDAGDSDHFKFNAVQGQEYRISIGNYGKIDSTTAIVRLYTPDGDDKYLMFNAVDTMGNQYAKYTAEMSGTYYIKIYNYHKEQFQYTIGVMNPNIKSAPRITYQTGVQQKGWLNTVNNGVISGTVGSGLRMEGLKIRLQNNGYSGNIEYRSHVQRLGWETTWRRNGELSGTNIEGLRLEAIQIRLTGEIAQYYDIYYRIHVQRFGWLDWAKNGEAAGTSGFGFRVEAIQIILVRKGSSAPGNTNRPFVNVDNTGVEYQTQVQQKGWLNNVSNGTTSGTVGAGLRMETLRIRLKNQGFSGAIEYRTHIQRQGWETTWKKNGENSGTVGQGLRLEALQLRLTGDMEKEYDIYYRVQAQRFGWLGWAKNGESAGTSGYGYRLEAIQIILVRKGMVPPGSTANHFYSA